MNLVHEIPCCKQLVMSHSNLTQHTRLVLGSLARGGRGVWQGKHGTVLMFSLKDRQWQGCSIYMIFLAALQTADLKLKD